VTLARAGRGANYPGESLLRAWRGCSINLAGPPGFHELERGLKQGKMLLVVGHVCAIDLYPFPCACHATGRKRDDVISGELQFGRRGHRQTQADALPVDAGEHLVAHEIGVEAVYFSCTGTGEFEEQSVDLRLAEGLGGIGIQRVFVGVGIKGEIKSHTRSPARPPSISP
jgi:hypothetical protein